MTRVTRFDPAIHTICLDRELVATKMPEQPDPPIPVDGVTFGVATMSENAPHGGERHADGDEILYLISGHVAVVFLDGDTETVDVRPGDGLVVPQGTWHRVDILEPSQIVYVTPGPNNSFKALPDSA